jgi:ubiquinone/menaquinone biosynthesis C-methylase UbiE
MTETSPDPGQRHFDRWASSYDRSILQRFMFGPVHRAVLDAVSASCARPHDVLDVGCGTGRLLEAVATRFGDARLTGVDTSAEMVAEARRKHEGDERFVFEQGNAAALPFPPESFDVVSSTMSFHHWADQAGGVREVSRVLRVGGLFALADIDAPFLSLVGPVMRWRGQANLQAPDAIRRMLEEADLSVESFRRFWPFSRTQIFVARKNDRGARTS